MTDAFDPALLGGMHPEVFLRDHWQKKPLLVRGAIPDARGIFDVDDLIFLAREGVLPSRAVRSRDGRRRPHYQAEDGPLDLTKQTLPRERFTFLVQGLESRIDAAWPLLRKFSFLSWARIDDVMVSYSTPLGTVGPHSDVYDVFLIQAEGRRRWQVAVDGDLTCRDDEELQILRAFHPTDEWVLSPGDMLYLPPEVGHHGVALDEGMTISVGFVAPTNEQLVGNFLAFLEGESHPRGMYTDPDLAFTDRPGEISTQMIERVTRTLDAVRFDQDRVVEFLGRYLTGPRPFVSFQTPKRRLEAKAFVEKLGASGVLSLSSSSRMLTRDRLVFMNGEAHAISDADVSFFRTLADVRSIELPCEVSDDARPLLHRFYRRGFIKF